MMHALGALLPAMQYCAVLCNDAGCGYNSSDSQDDAGPWPRVRQNAVDVALGVDADEPSWWDARAQAGWLSDATHFVERRFLPRPVGADAKGGDVSFFADLGILAQQRWQVGAAQPQPQRVFPASSALSACPFCRYRLSFKGLLSLLYNAIMP